MCCCQSSAILLLRRQRFTKNHRTTAEPMRAGTTASSIHQGGALAGASGGAYDGGGCIGGGDEGEGDATGDGGEGSPEPDPTSSTGSTMAPRTDDIMKLVASAPPRPVGSATESEIDQTDRQTVLIWDTNPHTPRLYFKPAPETPPGHGGPGVEVCLRP